MHRPGYQPHNASSVHPESILKTQSGREIQLKVHRGLWSSNFPENSLPAIVECFRAPVARTEIDICMLKDEDFLIAHPGSDFGHGPTDERFFQSTSRQEAAQLHLLWRGTLSEYQPPLLSEAVEAVAGISAPTLIELDMKDLAPLPWKRVEELARLIQPIKEQAVFNGTDWNLRRLRTVDSSLLMGFDPSPYLDWVPVGREGVEEIALPRGAYGYLDRHPLAYYKLTSIEEYLSDRLSGILRLVPGLREAHLRLRAFEQMLDDGVSHAAELFHREGIALDVWTLDAQTPNWHSRLARVVAAGVDIVTTNTAREMSAQGQTL